MLWSQVKPGIPVISYSVVNLLTSHRDGNDGPWSTFVIRVGTPDQVFRVLASTTVPETWVVSKDGCTSRDPSGCADDRGNLFTNGTSSTWEFEGNFELGVELNLPYRDFDRGGYGYDKLGVGYPGSGGPSLDHQVIAAIDTKDFYLGNLGLTPRPINFTWDNPVPSFLSTLKNQSVIPSLSFGYNAGAEYRMSTSDFLYSAYLDTMQVLRKPLQA